jgi:hypothetical protein
MRIPLILLIISINNTTFAQLNEGFDPNEAKALIAICNSFSFLEIYNSDTLIIPDDYQKIYTSEVLGLDNMFQVYEKGNTGVINFRGSTSKTSSWVENIFSAMIPAIGIIKVDSTKLHYKFASDSSAAVHSGYALAVVLLSHLLIEQIDSLNNKGIYHILITGHSQGGALAHLCRAYLENLPENVISKENVFKTYAFANPMCGNQEFKKEYEKYYSEINMSYSIINPADLVPKMPMHYQEQKNLYGNLFFRSWVYGIENINARRIKETIFQLFEPALKPYVYQSNRLIEKIVATSYVSIEMPEYVFDINYFQTGSIRELEPFPNPKITSDTINMTKKEIEKLKQDEDGNYYKKESSFFQHKPYQYYVAILKQYFSKDYKELDLWYLPEKK